MRNKWEKIGEQVIIYMNGSKADKCYTDEEGLKILLNYDCTWYAKEMKGLCYAFAKMKGKQYAMSRLLMDAKKGQMVDFIDGNTLNNAMSNLVFTNKRGCKLNSAKHSNVRFLKDKDRVHLTKPYAVHFTIDGKFKYFGYYATEEEALERANEVREKLSKENYKK
ncbi:HNH endonuclease [Bacillus phage BigBertha]|uniref:HNH endonuclease n=1 Tax=Bacillus phage BigBertha TaxID=1406781 RepID=U5PS08_9CAUD|nr:HNH endonuclease [Bacillus phage BigBertha]YP_009290101.1 HNH homing endonuclease [Bacillus phage Phrodo]QDH49919.1 HNH endonuclease [Bacillus phage Beyonphe]UGO50522.1 HNH endonuclease [Bacillus phage vB_BanH_RonSwanson]AGY46730.1 HNH endonuclease [Bacillus phage BigBertha]AMW62263.1 HNH homing endonuclease [Bacillus phage Phrodo]